MRTACAQHAKGGGAAGLLPSLPLSLPLLPPSPSWAAGYGVLGGLTPIVITAIQKGMVGRCVGPGLGWQGRRLPWLAPDGPVAVVKGCARRVLAVRVPLTPPHPCRPPPPIPCRSALFNYAPAFWLLALGGVSLLSCACMRLYNPRLNKGYIGRIE